MKAAGQWPTTYCLVRISLSKPKPKSSWKCASVSSCKNLWSKVTIFTELCGYKMMWKLCERYECGIWSFPQTWFTNEQTHKLCSRSAKCLSSCFYRGNHTCWWWVNRVHLMLSSCHLQQWCTFCQSRSL